jgi:hypothetical protein
MHSLFLALEFNAGNLKIPGIKFIPRGCIKANPKLIKVSLIK